MPLATIFQLYCGCFIGRENQQPATSHLQTLLHNVESSTHRHERDSNSQR